MDLGERGKKECGGIGMLFRTGRLKLYNFFARMRPAYRYAIGFLFFLTLFVVWRMTMFAAINTKLTSYKTHVSSLDQHAKLLATIKKNNKHLKRAIESLEDALNNIPSNSKTDSLGSNIDFVFNQAAQSGVTIGICLPQAELDEGWCQENKIFFELDGSFSQVQHFFDAIACQKRMIRCSRIHIVKLSNGLVRVSSIFNFYTMCPKNQKGEK